MVYLKIFYQQIILLIIVTYSLSSCKSMRQSYYIEKKFLLAKVKDTQLIQNKMPYNVSLTKFSSTSYHSGGGSHTSKWNSIDIYIDDTINNNRFSIDDRHAVFQFLKGNKYGIQYENEFKRRKTNQKIHRYSSLGTMAMGIFLLSKSGGDKGSPSKQEVRIGNTGGYLFTAGFLNWIGGGFGRALIRRPVPMKAMYAYYFGPLPKKVPRITRAERIEILKLFRSF